MYIPKIKNKLISWVWNFRHCLHYRRITSRDACVAQWLEQSNRQSKDLGSNPSAVESVFFSTERFSISLNIYNNTLIVRRNFANSKAMFTWRVHWFLSEIKAGHWFISWYTFTDIISDYFTDSGLESKDSKNYMKL